MRNLKEKMQKQSGFTLIEMLIVVAIIAILIAVSIPMVNGALEKARQATDAANERAAKAEIIVCYMADIPYGDDDGDKVVAGVVYGYDAASGKLVSDVDDLTSKTYGKCSDHKEKFISVSITKEGEVFMSWGTSIPNDLTADGADLCGPKVNS